MALICRKRSAKPLWGGRQGRVAVGRLNFRAAVDTSLALASPRAAAGLWGAPDEAAGSGASASLAAAAPRRLRAAVVVEGVPLWKLTAGPRGRLRRSVAEAFGVELKQVRNRCGRGREGLGSFVRCLSERAAHLRCSSIGL